MKCLVKCKFPSSDKLYDYYTEGSPNELSGFTRALVETTRGTVEVKVAEIRPLSEQVYDGKLKPIKEFLKDEQLDMGNK